MRAVDWIRRFFAPGASELYVDQKALKDAETNLHIEEFAVWTAINFIAGAVSKCEFRTYAKKQELFGEEYYLWNVEPNVNQNSSQFLQELVARLLYFGECLVVECSGQLIIAESFSRTEYAVRESLFSNVSRGTLTLDQVFPMSKVLYFKQGNNRVRELLLEDYSRLLSLAVGKYRRSGGRKGVAKIQKTQEGDADKQKRIDDLFQNRFRTYFEAENAVIHIPNGVDYNEMNGEGSKKSTSEIADITTLTREAFDRAAQAFKIPPALLRGDIADVEKITDNFLTFCIDPFCDSLCEEIVRKRYKKTAYLAGSYLEIDTTCIKHIDIFDKAVQTDKLIACGMYNIDELRRKARDCMLGTEWARRHWMTKNYENIEQVEKGDPHETE